VTFMSESPLVEYQGNCHCGAFKFTFKTPEIKNASGCNCAICSKNGYLFASTGNENNFVVVKGDENTTLKTYEFGKRVMAHKFCPTCGTSILARVKEPTEGSDHNLFINIRALADVDFWALKPATPWNGAALGEPYQQPEPVPTGPVPEGAVVYNGNCHCGAVAYTLLSPEKLKVATDCNCSICARDGVLWVYPQTSNVTFKGLDSLTQYTFGTGKTYHGFCKICGVAICELYGPKSKRTPYALNVRTMTGLDLAELELEKDDGKSFGAAYKV